MRRVARKCRVLTLVLSFTLVVVTCAEQRVDACYQLSPTLRIRARGVSGVITLNGKPMSGSLVRLYKSVASVTGPSAPGAHALAEAETSRNGVFTLGEFPSGKYVLFPGGPSGMSINVELVSPKSDGEDTILVDNYADGCISAGVLSAGGQKVKQDDRSIGMSLNRRASQN